MIMPSPSVSKWGLPALPSICMISWRLISTHRPCSGEYTWVPLMMTVWAGRFTPQASVAVETKIFKCLSANSSSTKSLSGLDKPAWWIPIPSTSSSFKSLLEIVYSFVIASRIFLLSESGLMILFSSSRVKAVYLSAFAVLTVSLREWTKMIICWFETLSITFS